MDQIPEIFFWQDYVENHFDLLQHGITTKETAIQHYLTHGKNERRNLYGTCYKLCFKYKNLFGCSAYISFYDKFLNILLNKYTSSLAIQKYFEYGFLFTHLLNKKMPNPKILNIGCHGFISRHDQSITSSDISLSVLKFLEKYHRQKPIDISSDLSKFTIISIFFPTSEFIKQIIDRTDKAIVFIFSDKEIDSFSLYYQTDDLNMYLYKP